LVKVVISGRVSNPLEEASRVIEVVEVGQSVRVAPEFIARLRAKLPVDLRPQSTGFAEFSGTKLQADEGGESVFSGSTAGATTSDGLPECAGFW